MYFLKSNTASRRIALTHSLFVLGALLLLIGHFSAQPVYADGTVYLPIMPTIDEAAIAENPDRLDVDSGTPTQHPITGQALYYVSKSGNNSNGHSWATAWNELDQINWNAIKPGSLILIDGGAKEMVYRTSLRVNSSGTQQAPITIQLSQENGRNGQAIFDGGRGSTLPYCGQSSYSDNGSKAQENGININNQSWVIIDGTKWRGINIYKYTKSGVLLNRGSTSVTLRNIEIHDNGQAVRSSTGWRPARPGIRIGGRNHTLDRLIIHDNGEDAIQSLWGDNNLGNITIIRSWLHNQRKHPSVNSESSNYCTHSDGFQIYDGGNVSGITLEETVIGPGFTNGIIFGQSLLGGNIWADVQNVNIRNVIFAKPAENGILGYPKTSTENWQIENTTLDCSNTKYNCVRVENGSHSMINSVMHSAIIDFPDGLKHHSNNCQWGTNGDQFGNTANPFFRAPSEHDPFALADYLIPSHSSCAGQGASITSVQKLLDEAANLTPTQPVGSPQQGEDFTCDAQNGTLIEAENGTLSGQFNQFDGHIEQEVEVDKPWLGGSATYSFNVPNDGHYHLRAMVDAKNDGTNSLYVNINGQPTVNYMVWDVGLTSGFEERMVSWRGDGTYEKSQFTPKIFYLKKGSHTLIIRGREAQTKLDKICIEQH